MQPIDDLRAAVARADEAIGCSLSTPHIRVELDAFAALYRAAKALVAAEEPRERRVDAEGGTRLPRAMREELGVGDETILVSGLDFATLEPYLNRDVEVMGARGTITEHKATSSSMSPAEPRCKVTSMSNEEVRAKWEATSELDNVLRTCRCFRCLDEPSMGPFNPAMRRMILCPQCGNKRCPRATSHDNACSGSNEPGQDGSEYYGKYRDSD